MMRLMLILALACAGWSAAAGVVDPANALVFDPPKPSYIVKPGDAAVRMTVIVKNVSDAEVVIAEVKTSCGCTTAAMPVMPCRLGPGETNKLEIVTNLRDKSGVFSPPATYYKDVFFIRTNITNTLLFEITIPPGFTNNLSARELDRLLGQQLATADHQAVFKNDCVTCHLVPAFGKTGAKLYTAVCGICHDAEHRASTVPDLRKLTSPADTNYWRTWVTYGKPGSMMPGFAATLGGPLDDAQINSLVEYLVKEFPRPGTATNSSK